MKFTRVKNFSHTCVGLTCANGRASCKIDELIHPTGPYKT